MKRKLFVNEKREGNILSIINFIKGIYEKTKCFNSSFIVFFEMLLMVVTGGCSKSDDAAAASSTISGIEI